MLNAIRAFWWVPLSRLRFARPELEQSAKGWLRLRAGGGRFMRNFGDELTPFILSRLTGRKVRWAPPAHADVVAVGSVLELCLADGFSGLVWGSGCRHDHSSDDESWRRHSRPTFVAVRGSRTASAVMEGADADLLPLGDPASLIPQFVTARKPRGRRGIFIPHFRTWNSRQGLEAIAAARQSGVEVVAPNRTVDSVVEQIHSAAYVLSSSLHGLILAHALGRPGIWVDSSTAIDAEPDFKFLDYGSSMDLALRPLSMVRLLAPDAVARHLDSRDPQVDLLRVKSEKVADGLRSALSAYI